MIPLATLGSQGWFCVSFPWVPTMAAHRYPDSDKLVSLLEGHPAVFGTHFLASDAEEVDAAAHLGGPRGLQLSPRGAALHGTGMAMGPTRVGRAG